MLPMTETLTNFPDDSYTLSPFSFPVLACGWRAGNDEPSCLSTGSCRTPQVGLELTFWSSDCP